MRPITSFRSVDDDKCRGVFLFRLLGFAKIAPENGYLLISEVDFCSGD
jgi:hypothetical protein